jgi:AcrR family transcriptional regulator
LTANTTIVMEPRKKPVQQRSTATVTAILDATIQVLTAIGKERLTTTRVAQRAGVSVGTLYQYFPNKRALLQAALRRHLTTVTEAVELACELNRNEPLCKMVSAIADAFFRTKMKEPRVSLALYSVSSDVDGFRILEELRVRNTQALTTVLATAPERLTIDLELADFMLQGAMTGVSRRMLEARIPAKDHDSLRNELAAMLCAYVVARTA